MELQEDAYRLQQVLEDISPKDIIKFLRTRVSLADTEIRCELALQHFLNIDDTLAKQEESYERDLKADFLCIRHLLKSVPDEEIKELLNILGSIPNRKHVAVKLLLRQSSQSFSKKRKNNVSTKDICEARCSKIVKIADSDEEFQTNNNVIGNLNQNSINITGIAPKHQTISESGLYKCMEMTNGVTDQREPLKLTIKSVKDRNGVDKFVVSSPTKTSSEPYSPKNCQTEVQNINTTTNEVVNISDPNENIEFLPSPSASDISNTTWQNFSPNNRRNDLPSTSSNFQSQPIPFQNHHEFYSTLEDVPSTSQFKQANGLEDVPSTSQFKQANEVENLISNEVELISEDNNSNQNQDGGIDLSKGQKIVDEKLVLKLIEMFPDASSDYIRSVCEGKEWSAHNFDEIVTVILSTADYPRRPERQPSPPKEVDPEDQLNLLKNVLTDADPSYLQEKLDHFAGDQEGLRHFIEDALENRNYPTLKEYLRKQQVSAQQRQYTTEFDVERFVELFPDPEAIFEDSKRKTTILDQSDKCYVKWFMRNKYNQLYAKDVNSIVETKGNINIVSIIKALSKLLTTGSVKKSRWVAPSRPDTQNIPLLQELAYFEHKKQIYEHIEAKKSKAAQERANAKELGLLQTCSCCYDEEVMPNDILTCTEGCRFCRDCIKRGTEVAFSEGKLEFPCLMDCGAEFSLPVLQNVLPPKVFSKLAQKKAVAEVKAAGIEDLETCPFCDFATIPAPEDKLFRCLNPDCMKESCRLCKEPSHVPLRCDEVEKDEAVKARTYIEDKMTEALIRQCWKCNAKFIKEEGCNKMTCSCGAIMCYVCRKPVKDYKHFNGQGGDRYDLCPLYTDNFLVNEKNVLKAAEEAKKEIDPAQLKNDPTADLQKHFGDKIKEAEQRARQRHVGAGMPIEHYNEVQRLRHELREQLRMIRDLNRHDRRQIVNQYIPHVHAGHRHPPHVHVGHRHVVHHPPPAHQANQPIQQRAAHNNWEIAPIRAAMQNLNRFGHPNAPAHPNAPEPAPIILPENPTYGPFATVVREPVANEPPLQQQQLEFQPMEDFQHVNGFVGQ